MRSTQFRAIVAKGLVWLGGSGFSAEAETELPAKYFTLLAGGVAGVA
jgi:hypothetical protein